MRSRSGFVASIAAVLGISLVVFVVAYRSGNDGGAARPPQGTPSLERGERVYREYCQVCHGVSGGGDGPGAAGLNPPVVDFRVHFGMGHTDALIFDWVSNGIPGTAMPAFKGRLTSEERWGVITFVRRAFTPAEK